MYFAYIAVVSRNVGGDNFVGRKRTSLAVQATHGSGACSLLIWVGTTASQNIAGPPNCAILNGKKALVK